MKLPLLLLIALAGCSSRYDEDLRQIQSNRNEERRKADLTAALNILEVFHEAAMDQIREQQGLPVWHYGNVYSNVTASPIPRPRDWKGVPHVDVVQIGVTNRYDQLSGDVTSMSAVHIQTRSHIAIMQSYLDGREIEFNPDRRGQWLDCPQPDWDFFRDEYRVKTKER